ncbi:MAG: hypothetical protein ABEI39_06635 [Halobacteriales archaeon]
MQPRQDARRDSPRRHGETPAAEVAREAIHLRSYDHQWAYDLDVEVVTEDGESAFRERYYLLPGRAESESLALPDGEYEVRVTLDNAREERLNCRIDSTPEGTAVVEVGNGALGLTEGL